MPFSNSKQANNAQGQLQAGVSASATSFILQTGQGSLFPSQFPFWIKAEQLDTEANKFRVLKRELLKVTNRVNDTLTVVRGAGFCPASYTNNTQTNTAFSFNVGDVITQVLPAEQLDEIQNTLATALQSSGGTLTGTLKGGLAAAIASAATTDLNSVTTGNQIHITGSATITSFGTVTAGTVFECVFDGAATITHNAVSLILPGSTNIVASAGDTMAIMSEGGGNWRVLSYQKANGQALVASVDINGLPTVTNVADTDKLLGFNVSAGANRGFTVANFRKTMGVYGGTGVDGAVDGTADITITGSNNTHIIKNFSSWAAGNAPTQAYTNDPANGTNIVLNMPSTASFAIGDYVRVSSSAGTEVAQVTAVATNVSITVDNLSINHTTTSPLVTRLRKLSVAPTGCIVEIRIPTDADFSNWYIDGKGKGSLGAPSGVVGSGSLALGTLFNVAPGNGGVSGNGSVPSPQPTPITTSTPILTLAGIFNAAPGAGGGSGWVDNGNQSEGGGNGGGCFYFQVRGNCTFSANSTVVDVRGNDGTNLYTYGGAGGGGGGGFAAFGVTGTITGTPITRLNGGVGSAAGSYLNSWCSGANGGNSIIAAGSQGSANNGVGGNGAVGYFTAQNV